jgi:diamine N-acetyltransferase
MTDEWVSLREVTEGNRQEVLAIRVAPGQERFVSSVAESLEEAEAYRRASPWYRAVYVGAVPVGFVMLSWDCVPQPPEIIGPWFLWKLLIDDATKATDTGAKSCGRLPIGFASPAAMNCSRATSSAMVGPAGSTNDSASCPLENLTHKARSSSDSSCERADPWSTGPPRRQRRAVVVEDGVRD